MTGNNIQQYILAQLVHTTGYTCPVDMIVHFTKKNSSASDLQIHSVLEKLDEDGIITIDTLGHATLIDPDSVGLSGKLVVSDESHTPEDDIANGVHYKNVVITQEMVGQPLDPMMIDYMYQQVGQPLTLAQNTIIKKTLAAGKRGKKSKRQDMLDVIGSAKRQIALWNMGDANDTSN